MKKYLAIGATVVISLGVYEGMKSYLLSAEEYYSYNNRLTSEAFSEMYGRAEICNTTIEAPVFSFKFTKEERAAHDVKAKEWRTKYDHCLKVNNHQQWADAYLSRKGRLETFKGIVGEFVYDLT
ncbi:hypothetical protein BCU90_17410 [Vibrio lentus]|uniref:hypothetical protein n=1 Tax=Vibrio lentus TaxID=136468 RepID=UPI000C85EC60|nr:hypothetical protein [Vibrio lentus]PMG45642.1 hypothetical protein BCU90_17410 [Vibrio lentus]